MRWMCMALLGLASTLAVAQEGYLHADLRRETERMSEFVETILQAPPGMTGLWQVSGRNRLTFEQRLRLDEYYVRNWSLWMDVVVLVKTIGALLRREGAY